MKKRGEILCIIVILRGTKMEIDNWQTMILIFEVVCRIFKKQGRERICRFDVRNDARNGKREV